MPNRCVADACGNMPSDSVSLFRFPKEPHLCDLWTRQVQRTRANWKPTSASVLCSEHFSVDCFFFFFFFRYCAGQRFIAALSHNFRVGGGVHDSYTFQCGLVGSFTSPGIDTR